ncbi:uncharacterized protein N7477_007123 [Penicillium maclennaniae]|uniref:uncharacterized protein n=1 Tax=Penicillium maclennaniae TaxID=1343394 RepID=UPI002541E57B|nr:uncharacterized protein N7477_007123 [Penicillium maclennaniae]KAJ5668553.1 hypothetical protein N7477_007123 [Penicillium maclennaniae]
MLSTAKAFGFAVNRTSQTPKLEKCMIELQAPEAIGLSVKQFAPQVKVIGVDIIRAAESSETSGFLCRSSIADQQIKLLSSLAAVHENRHVSDHDYGDKDFMTEAMDANAGVVDEMIMVEPLEIQAAVKDTFRETRGIVDINGALAVAGMMRYASKASKEPSRGCSHFKR